MLDGQRRVRERVERLLREDLRRETELAPLGAVGVLVLEDADARDVGIHDDAARGRASLVDVPLIEIEAELTRNDSFGHARKLEKPGAFLPSRLCRGATAEGSRGYMPSSRGAGKCALRMVSPSRAATRGGTSGPGSARSPTRRCTGISPPCGASMMRSSRRSTTARPSSRRWSKSPRGKCSGAATS